MNDRRPRDGRSPDNGAKQSGARGAPGSGDPSSGTPGAPGSGDPSSGTPGAPGSGDPGSGTPGAPGTGDPGATDQGAGANSTVAVVGTGLVGSAWAICFARAGMRVRLWDQDLAAVDAAQASIPPRLDHLAKLGLLGGQQPAEVAARLEPAETLREAVAGVSYVQESVAENLEIKRAVFSSLDAAADAGTILASSSTAIRPSRFTEHLTGRSRTLLAHPINPPYLVPAVEVVPAPWTDPAVVARAAAFMEQTGQRPIVMQKEIDGFVMNRLQAAVLAEAFWLVENGYASAEDVDRGIKDGLGLRWAFMGPFETIDLNAPRGVRDYAGRFGPAFNEIMLDHPPYTDWHDGAVLDEVEGQRRELLGLDEIADRQAWRDRRLTGLIAHLRDADRSDGGKSS